MMSTMNEPGEIDTGTTDLIATRRDGVLTLTLNRPERRNAMTPAMTGALAEQLHAAETSELVGAVVITGAGAAFCAGGDVKGFNERGGEGGAGATVADPARIASQQSLQRATVGRIYRLAKPVVAALPGAAAGAGLGYALAADLRIGCPRTLLATAFTGVGLSGDFGVAWLLSSLVGPSLARELMFLGERVDSVRALELGLLNRSVPEDELPGAAFELASRLANGPQAALRAMKANLLNAGRLDLETAMDLEVGPHMTCGVTEDHRNAVAAFVEKRKPVFSAAWRRP
jgi:2-(1,2-epoxy-1,2-dihydrophenyl)acetyl-CoA isomerase